MSAARQRFIGLLRDEILQVDAAELDFGIYRVLNHRRAELDRYLGEELPAQIARSLAQLPGDAAGEDEEARIYNALFTFFSRYYEDGDFMPRARRGKDGAYSVAYDGSDTFFHWATRGSHYVKSGERFASYAYVQPGGTRVRFTVTQAQVEKDNAKGAARYYVPATLAETDGEWRVGFAWRMLDAKEQSAWGGKSAKAATTKDNEDDEVDSTVEGKSPQDRILNAWIAAWSNGKASPFGAAKPPANLDRTLLEKYARRFVRGQQSDFFVHPQLGPFLNGELDYYLKNEFVSMWDLPDTALARERGKYRIVRELGQSIIRVLHALEAVQAAFFEKRKFVMSAHYLVQCSRLAAMGENGAALVKQAAANGAQVAEWAAWVGETKRVRGPELLKRYPHLPLNTANFDEVFKWDVLACVPDLSAAILGVLGHGDNFAALRTFEPTNRASVKCVYADPPYNTDASPIAYKNDFKESSWLGLIESRMRVASKLMSADAAICVTIDDFEVNRLTLQLFEVFGESNHWATVPIRSKPQGRATTTGFSVNHEYGIFFAGGTESMVGRLPREGARAERYREKDERGRFTWANFRKTGSDSLKSDREGQYFPLYVKGISLRVPSMVWEAGTRTWSCTPPEKDEVAIWPVDDEGVERVWSIGADRAKADIESGDIECRIHQSRPSIYRKYRPNEDGALPVTWWADPKYSASESGTKLLQDAGLDPTNIYPKSLHAVVDTLRILGSTDEAIALDFFAGSGTTGHAVINLNREDGGQRKFILVDQGEYFGTVMLPRIAKLMTSPGWRDGKPKEDVAHNADDDPDHWSRRSPPLVQVLKFERYEDSLDALQLRATSPAQGSVTALDTLITYLASTPRDGYGNTQPVSLSTAKLTHPFDYRLPTVWDGRYAEQPVDMFHSALLLLGLHPVRVRRLVREGYAPGGGVYLLGEVRPHRPGRGAAPLELLVLRTVDESQGVEALQVSGPAEYRWLGEAVHASFGCMLDAYALIRHNRDMLLLDGLAGESIDAPLALSMWAGVEAR